MSHDIESFIRETLGERVMLSGKVIYSPLNTLRPAPLLLMGHNPGGGGDESIDATLIRLRQRTTNEFLSEDWGSGAGKHKLQRSVQRLFTALDANLDATFSTNLIFFRSQSIAALNKDLDAKLCWPIHERFIEIVDPDLLFVFGVSGTSPFKYLQEQAGETASEHQCYSADHGDWTIRSFRGVIGKRSRLVFGFPHLSRYMLKPHSEGGRAAVVAYKQALANRSG